MSKPIDNPSQKYQPVSAAPVKSFFVSMLTRDITLQEAILDLLDNCVDGIKRTSSNTGAKPYDGYWAEITYDQQTFSIADNCGGIPWELSEYAFRMGRDPERELDATGVVGVYGIGMKRAIFKMGSSCEISTQHGEDNYEVNIDPDWLIDETNWDLPVIERQTNMPDDGTVILVGDLNPGIAAEFGDGVKGFTNKLLKEIGTHYAYIIEKGFKVIVNAESVKPLTTRIVFDTRETVDGDTIRPFVFQTNTDDVEVYMAVGFTRPIPSENEIRDEQEAVRYSSIDAGWTIICNDRAVIHCDRTELTGWGESGVPRYHTQFIAISGIVEFRSEDPSKLPTTTTKRGIDASSPLYLQVKNKMREGMRVFTDYTNKWKGLADESKQHIELGRTLSLPELKASNAQLTFSTTRTLPPGHQYKPKLPRPPKLEPTTRRITFVKEVEKITLVADYLGDSEMKPSDVGEDCFDAIYTEVSS